VRRSCKRGVEDVLDPWPAVRLFHDRATRPFVIRR
jgi:hypothetical protein